MTTPHPMSISVAQVRELAEAVQAYSRAIAQAKRAWEIDTHPMKRPTPEAIDMANERFRIAFIAAIRVHHRTILDLDERGY